MGERRWLYFTCKWAETEDSGRYGQDLGRSISSRPQQDKLTHLPKSDISGLNLRITQTSNSIHAVRFCSHSGCSGGSTGPTGDIHF